MAEMKKKQKCPEGVPEYMLTYGDMVTLLLTFFVLMYTTATVDGSELKLIISAFNGLGVLEGGNTLSVGKLAELGNTIESMPSMQAGRSLDSARQKARSLFQPEIATNKVRVFEDERGLIISLAGDAFFREGSAELDIDESRDMLQRMSGLLIELSDRFIRFEGHTDSIPTDPNGPYPSNWELSGARAYSVMRYLTDYGVSEDKLHFAGYADTRPIETAPTVEARAYNRRVDIVILTDSHM